MEAIQNKIHAPAFMPCPQPLRAWLGNLNHKRGCAKGDPPKKTDVVHKGAKRECHTWFWEGKGVR
eukprot:10075608-Ditylum_brightwellii.AAC.1